MANKTTRRTVLVTGAMKGIGRAIAEAFAKTGCNIALNDIAVQPDTQQLIKSLSKGGGKAKAYLADISNAEAVAKMVQDIVKDFGHVDVLVNNAGIIGAHAWNELTTANWEKTWHVNVLGTFNCMQKFGVAVLASKRTGAIVNIASIRGFPQGTRDVRIDYSATKAAVINLTASFAKVLAPHIRVNAVAPGPTETSMNDDWPKGRKEEMNHVIPVGRMNEPADIANAVVFLASDQAATITGQTLIVDGGGTLITPV